MKKNLFLNENIFILLGILLILPFIYISNYSNPSADDFCFGMQTQNLGYWNAQVMYYTKWTGRYFSTALLSLNPWFINKLFIYKLLPVMLILSLFISFYYLAKTIFIKISSKDSLFLAIYFMILYILQMPSIAQGFYWMSAALSYQIANILLVFLLAAIIKLIRTQKIKYLISSILLSIFIIGSNETSMLLVDALLFIVFVYNSFIKGKINYMLLTLLVFAGIFSAAVIFAPGNIIRSARFTNNHEFINSTFSSIQEVYNHLIRWIPLVLAINLVLFNKFGILIKKGIDNIFKVHPIIAISTIVIIPFIAFFPSYWTSNSCPPPRTINVIYFMFILSFTYFSFVLIHFSNVIYQNSIRISPWIKYILILFIMINLLNENNFTTAYSDIFKKTAKNYDLELKERFDIISKSNEDPCVVPQLKNKPKTLYFDDITGNLDDWRNACHNGFFGKPIVVR